MKKEMLSITDRFFLSVILLIAAVLRLWNLSSVPFMHDEFSALSRTVYDSFSELLQEGVMRNDSHPAGVQAFLYLMVRVVGWSEFWLKLPFAFMGIASVYLVFKIGQQWYNTNVGLVSAAFVSVSELFVFYSQLIRPYTPGLFFILLSVYFWNKILFGEKKASLLSCLGFAVSAFLSSQMHNFSLAEAGLIWLSGLFFLKKDDKARIKAYVLSGLAALLLFLPTSPIFYHQLFVRGGIGGWLPMPKYSFIIDFMNYSLNYSWLFVFTIIILIASPFLTDKINKNSKRGLRITALLWFVIPFLVAFLYSFVKEPILQFSTLIFGFPFLVITLFSFYEENTVSVKEKTIAVGAILIVGISSLILDRQYYKQVYTQAFDGVANAMKECQEKYGDSITFLSYADRSFMNEFYQNKENISNNIFYDQNVDLLDFQNDISKLDTKYLGVGLTDYHDIKLELLPLAYYPNIIDTKQWFTGKYLLLSKEKSNRDELKSLISNVKIKKGQAWACSNSMMLDTIDTDALGFIAEIQSVDTIHDILLAIELRNVKNDSLLFWNGGKSEGKVFLPNERTFLVNGLRLSDLNIDSQDVKLKVYIWNRGLDYVEVNNLFYYETKNDPYFLGIYEPLK